MNKGTIGYTYYFIYLNEIANEKYISPPVRLTIG